MSSGVPSAQDPHAPADLRHMRFASSCPAGRLRGGRDSPAAAADENAHRSSQVQARRPSRFDPTVAAGDREWILAAVDKVRPEARQLIDDVDGMVTISTSASPARRRRRHRRSRSRRARIPGALQPRLPRRRAQGRPRRHRRPRARPRGRLRARCRPSCATSSPAQLPPSGACFTADTGDCTAPEERFADTFAKWALRGAVSAVGAGYGTLATRLARGLGRAAGDAGDQVEVASR